MGHVEYRSGRGHIVVPSFQRGLVWNEEKRQRFIDSIKRGLPVGVILLFVDGVDANGRTRYRLVDGLQRSSTLRRYVEDMFSYFSYDDAPAELIEAATNLDPGQRNKENLYPLIRQAIGLWVKGHSGDATHLSALALYERLCSLLKVGSVTINQNVFGLCESFLQSVQRDLDIRDRQIGVIEFSGEKADLPIIFDRLNTGGVFLNKYDVLAADWDDVDSLRIGNEQIKTAIKGKYQEFIDLGLEFDGRTGDALEQFNAPDFHYTLFEFVFGMGRVLRSKFPKLYGGRRELKADVDAVGFNLAALTNGRPIVQLGKFKDDYRRYPSLDRYFEALVETSETVETILTPVLGAIIDKQRRKPRHTDFQMAALVAGVFREHYESNFSQKASWTASLPKIRKALPQRYLFDIVNASWRGSGDSKAFAFVQDGRITESVDASAIGSALDAWFTESVKLRGKKDELDPVGELLLKYLGAIIARNCRLPAAEFGAVSIVPDSLMRAEGLRVWNVANILLACDGGKKLYDPCGSLTAAVAEKPAATRPISEWLTSRVRELSTNLKREYFKD
jgi:hypothetical protein